MGEKLNGRRIKSYHNISYQRRYYFKITSQSKQINTQGLGAISAEWLNDQEALKVNIKSKRGGRE